MGNHKANLKDTPNYQRQGSPSPTHLCGSDFLGKLSVKAKSNRVTPSDNILLRQPISASSFPGTRLSQLSQLWERYRWSRCNVRYVNAVPETLACQLVAYIDTDPSDDPTVIPDVDALLRQGIAQAGSRQWNFSQDMVIPLFIRSDDQLYYTGVDKLNERFTLQGVLYILQSSDAINFNGELLTSDLECGNLFLDWGCHFSMPQINPVAADVVAPTELKLIATVGFTPGQGFITASALEPNTDHVISIEFTAGIIAPWAPQSQPPVEDTVTFSVAGADPTVQFERITTEYSTNDTQYIVNVGNSTGGAVAKSNELGQLIFTRSDASSGNTSIFIYGNVKT